MIDAVERARRLVESLQQSRCYPHGVGPIELRETHISWVLLTGEYAYKIKKPVQLDFLDFSTLAKRKFYCEEELRLNRRFAAQIYLDVVPVCGPIDAPCVNGSEGEPLEYALKLKQFAAEEELSALLEHAAVQAEDLAGFGQLMAQIHATAPASDKYSSAEQTHNLISANSRELLSLLTPEQRDGLSAVLEWLEHRQYEIAEIIEVRGLSSRVRECHGDLHAGNIVRLQGTLRPFDCIEFDESLRFIDVVNDVAFLYMDLVARGHPALAYAFLNGWLEESGDYQGVRLLGVFQTYRALVRAKVSLLRKAHDEAARYLLTAAQRCHRPLPRLILTCGLSGSGKTWLSSRLVPALQAVRIRSDVERKRLVGLKAHESSHASTEAGMYTLEFNRRVYEHLRSTARSVLQSGESIIVDAAFLKRAERESFVAMANEMRVPASIVHCVAPREVLVTRLVKRSAAADDASEADVAVMEQQVNRWQPFSKRELPLVVEVDSSTPDAVERVVKILSERCNDKDRDV